MNSTFALWFLSTIVVGLATWAYSSHEDSLRSAARDRETLQRLDTEIAGRVQYCIQYIEGRRVKLDAQRLNVSNRPMLFLQVADCLDGSSGSVGGSGIYEEYAHRKFPALIIEIRRLLPRAERQSVADASAAYYDLRRISESGDRQGGLMRTDPDQTAAQLKEAEEAIEEASRLVKEQIWISRWKV